MSALSFDHVGLSVANLDVQRRFYADALGMTVAEEELEMPDAGIRTAILRNAHGLKIELIERSGSAAQEFADAYAGANVQGYFHWALYSNDLDATFVELLAAGATAVSTPGPAARPGARFAYVKDPEGNLLEIIQPSSDSETLGVTETAR